MLPYWFLFLVPVCLAASRPQRELQPDARWPTLWVLVYILLVLSIGLRHEVGGDWLPYEEILYSAVGKPFFDAVSLGDPAYSALNWMSAQLEAGPYLLNTGCAAVFAWGLVSFCRAQPRPWLALVVAMPYLVIVVAMGYTRQGVAIGLAMLALTALSDQKVMRFVVFLALATAFHKSAVILMPLAILGANRRRLWTAIWVGISSFLFYVLLLQSSTDLLVTNYVGTEYQSSGAAIRVAMNILPAVLFLAFRRRFVLSAIDRSFWTWMSLAAILFVLALWLSPSSTAVDRIALYWIPLQLFVLARLPDALGVPHGQNDFWVLLIVAYSAVVLFVWLSFADHAFAWLPYQFYPWVLLWQ